MNIKPEIENADGNKTVNCLSIDQFDSTQLKSNPVDKLTSTKSRG